MQAHQEPAMLAYLEGPGWGGEGPEAARTAASLGRKPFPEDCEFNL